MTDTPRKTEEADPFDRSITQSLLVEKSRLELAMRSAPRSLSIRTMYFEVLNRLSQSHLGWFFALFPEINTPLLFRSASSDLFNLRQIYLDYSWGSESFYYGEYGFDIPRPNRILDLGAYCGYTPVYFANRFADAQIICVEPSASSFRLLLANTAPYPNIRCLPAAVWHERAELKHAGQLLGDWGNFFSPTGGFAAERVVPGYTISDILQMHGWTSADFIKCVVEDASVPVLSNPVRPWLDELTCVATKPVAGSWPHPDDEASLRAAFPDEEFEQSSRGAELIVFMGRSRSGAAPPTAPTPVRLIPSPPQTRYFTLSTWRTTPISTDLTMQGFSSRPARRIGPSLQSPSACRSRAIGAFMRRSELVQRRVALQGFPCGSRLSHRVSRCSRLTTRSLPVRRSNGRSNSPPCMVNMKQRFRRRRQEVT